MSNVIDFQLVKGLIMSKSKKPKEKTVDLVRKIFGEFG